MSEGLFPPSSYPFESDILKDKLIGSAVKVMPKRKLIFDIFSSESERDSWSSGFTSDEHGFETIKIGYTEEELSKSADPEFAQQIGNFEFFKLLAQGKKFPKKPSSKGVHQGSFLVPMAILLQITISHLELYAAKA